MKKITLTLIAVVAMLTTASAQSTYKILYETDTIVKAKIESVALGSRPVHYIIYEYPSKDGEGKDATVSGVVLIPSDVMDGSVPCDGIILYNHFTIGNPSEAPSQGGIEVQTGILASPLKPNYIVVSSDYIGYGSSIDRKVSYLCGDTNARNSLDGLVAARQMLTDKNVPLGKFQFNIGYSQGGTETMYIAKLRDMEYKDKGITFDKSFSGGGVLDCEKAYSEFVKKDVCDSWKDVATFLISVNENYHLGINYSDLFKEPVASNAKEYVVKKDKSVLTQNSDVSIDSLHQLLQPAYMNLNSDQAKALSAKLSELKIANGWEPDPTQNYFIEHSRHDNYVPIQSSRAMITWMKKKDFKPSLVPGKSSLQTNTLVFKLNHQISAAVWFVQTMAAIQYWPVVYYEGEQNRYYHDVVHDMNLMKVVKYIEGWGIDLRALVKNMSAKSAPAFVEDMNSGFSDGSLDPQGSVRQLSAPRRASFFEVIAKISDALAKVDLTIEDAYEMLDDSGITLADVMAVYTYLTSDSPASAAPVNTLAENVEVPVYLMRQYEQTLANWLLLGGIDVNYSQWGW